MWLTKPNKQKEKKYFTFITFFLLFAFLLSIFVPALRN